MYPQITYNISRVTEDLQPNLPVYGAPYTNRGLE